MIRLEKRPTPSKTWTYLTPLVAVLATMVAGGLMFALLGKDPFEAIRTIFWDPLFNEQFASYSRPQLLVKAAPLILIAVGLSLGFRAGVWNIGAEGQFVIGAIAAGGVALLAGKETGRWIVVAVLLVAAVLVAPTLRAFLNQQLEISAAREEIATMQAQREDYERRIQLWDDPAYVTQQARERLELVMPGETLYSVTGRPSETETDTEAEDTPAAGADEVVNTRLPWAEGLWDSAVRAGLE